MKNKHAKDEQDPENAKKGPNSWAPYVFLAIWARHYANRGWFFPLTIRVADGGTSSFALQNSLIGMLFLTLHGYLNARMFTEFGEKYTPEYFKSKTFILGMLLYEVGFWITVHSEHVLKNLRPAGQVITAANRYKIPYGGMFKYVTSPQYLGELMAWSGFVVLTGSPSALPVLLISLANLVPRSTQNQIWYLKKFDNYPKDRKALIPFLW